MKRLSVVVLYLVIFSFCSCGGGESVDPSPPQNTAPSVPNLIYPTNNLVCINNTIKFEWSAATDPQNDALTYVLEIATDNAFTQNLNSSTISSLSQQITLEKGKLYYWRVKATDAKNASSSFSTANNFYTEGIGVTNHLPFAPVLVSPALNTTQKAGTVNLSWTAVDADVSDVLKYDLYLGTVNPPVEKVVSDASLNTFSATLTNAGSYYWKVVVKDSKGGTTVGQVWNFKTN